MHFLQSCSVPQMDFASMSMLVGNNGDGGSSNEGSSSAADSSSSSLSCVNLSSVISPLSTTSPTVARISLGELHQFLIDKATPRPRTLNNDGDDDIDGKQKLQNVPGKNANGDGDAKVLNQNNDDDGVVNSNDNHDGENISSRIQAQHEGLMNLMNNNDDEDGIIVNDNEHYNMYPSRSTFHQLCLEEDEMCFNGNSSDNKNDDGNPKSEKRSGSTDPLLSSSSSHHGVFRTRGRIAMEYIMITERDLIEKCVSAFLMGSGGGGGGKQHKKAVAATTASVQALIVAVAITGAPYAYHSYPMLSSIRRRLQEFHDILYTSTFQICVTKSTAENQRHDLELMLTSLIMDDESLKTNMDVDIENGNWNQEMAATTPGMMFRASKYHNGSNGTSSSSGSSKAKLFKKKLFSERKRRRKKGERKKDEINDMSLKDMTSTAIISSSAPSSEVAKILSDQMQVLSLAEKGMMLRGYEGKTKASKKLNVNNHERGASGMRSPMRNIRRNNAGKDKIASGGDLAGFDYVPTATSMMTMWNPVMSASSSDMAWLQSSSSDNTSVTTMLTATTSTTDSTSATSSSSIPTLSGPIRDSSATKKQIRRNKVMKASMANQYSRAWNTAASLENGEKNRNMLSPPRYRDNDVRSKFDPFASDEGEQDDGGNNSKNGTPVRSNGFASPRIRTMTTDSATSFFSAPPEKDERRKDLTKSSSDISDVVKGADTSYIPGSRKLFTIMALNEDLACTYHGSTIVSCQVEGIVQLQLKSESTAFVPFTIQVWDGDDHIKSITENAQYAKNISKEAALDLNNGWKHKYVVTMPKADNYYPILKYTCTNKVVPVPLRVQSKVRTNGKSCRVAIQISSNPSNEKKLTELMITMSVPENVIGETLKTMPDGGVWNEEKRHVLWCVKELGRGEKFQLQGQFALHKADVFGVKDDELAFPISVRCQSMSAQLSNVKLECLDSKKFPADVSMKFARRFRVAQKEYLNVEPRG